jgi:hypothetical protein
MVALDAPLALVRRSSSLESFTRRSDWRRAAAVAGRLSLSAARCCLMLCAVSGIIPRRGLPWRSVWAMLAWHHPQTHSNGSCSDISSTGRCGVAGREARVAATCSENSYRRWTVDKVGWPAVIASSSLLLSSNQQTTRRGHCSSVCTCHGGASRVMSRPSKAAAHPGPPAIINANAL